MATEQSMVERAGAAFEAAWNSGKGDALNLPPIEFSEVELHFLMRAAIDAALVDVPAPASQRDDAGGAVG